MPISVVATPSAWRGTGPTYPVGASPSINMAKRAAPTGSPSVLAAIVTARYLPRRKLKTVCPNIIGIDAINKNMTKMCQS